MMLGNGCCHSLYQQRRQCQQWMHCCIYRLHGLLLLRVEHRDDRSLRHFSTSRSFSKANHQQRYWHFYSTTGKAAMISTNDNNHSHEEILKRRSNINDNTATTSSNDRTTIMNDFIVYVKEIPSYRRKTNTTVNEETVTNHQNSPNDDGTWYQSKRNKSNDDDDVSFWQQTTPPNQQHQQQSVPRNGNHDHHLPTESNETTSIVSTVKQRIRSFVYNTILQHFVPTNYPHSVHTGYTPYVIRSFGASVAGSASMVLSTQTLLLALMVAGTGNNDVLPVEEIINNNNSESYSSNVINEEELQNQPQLTITTASVDDVDSNVIAGDGMNDNEKNPMSSINENSVKSASAVASTGIMAGALNWVFKDGIGQLGGIWFASYIGRQQKQQESSSFVGGIGGFDTNPRYWRMVASLSLDCATLLELTSPFVPTAVVVPLACTSTVLKNIGFITASASRAAIHQTLITVPKRSQLHVDSTTTTATTTTTTKITYENGGNLADVTAKCGSQSMAAGLIGTAVGIGISMSSILQHNVVYYLGTFLVLSSVHQFCTYTSLQSIAQRTFNTTRIEMVLNNYVDEYIQIHQQQQQQNLTSASVRHKTDTSTVSSNSISVLSPEQVAREEPFLPLVSNVYHILTKQQKRDTPKIVIGSGIASLCPKGYNQLIRIQHCLTEENDMLLSVPTTREKYLLNVVVPTETKFINHVDAAANVTIHLTFLENATGLDLIKGMLHARILKKRYIQYQINNKHNNNNNSVQTNNDDDCYYLISQTYVQTNDCFSHMMESIFSVGWDTNSLDAIAIEPNYSKRISILLQ